MATPIVKPKESTLLESNERLSSILGGLIPWWLHHGDPVDTLRMAGLSESVIRNVVSIQLNARAAITEHYAEALKVDAKASRDIATALDKVQVKQG